MQVGGQDVKVLTCESCAKSSKRSPRKESEDSGMLYARILEVRIHHGCGSEVRASIRVKLVLTNLTLIEVKLV